MRVLYQVQLIQGEEKGSSSVLNRPEHSCIQLLKCSVEIWGFLFFPRGTSPSQARLKHCGLVPEVFGGCNSAQ